MYILFSFLNSRMREKIQENAFSRCLSWSNLFLPLPSFFYHSALLELRLLWFSDIIKLKQVWFLDILGYMNFPLCFMISFMTCSNDKHVQGEDDHNTRAALCWAEIKSWKCWWQGAETCENTQSALQRTSGMTSENHSLSGDCGRLSAAQNRNLPTLCNFQAFRSSAALFPGKSNKQTCKQTNPLSSSSITTNTSLTFCWWFLMPLRYIHLRKRKHIKIRLGNSLGPVGWQRSKGKGNGTTKKSHA